MILLVWVSNASQGSGTLWSLQKVGGCDQRPRKDFHPVGAVLAGHRGTAPCFPVLWLPRCQTECWGGHGLCSLGLRNIMALAISPTNREDKWGEPFLSKAAAPFAE